MKRKEIEYDRVYVGELYELGYVQDGNFIDGNNLGLLEMS